MGFIKNGQQILRRMRFQGIVDQEMDQQFWGEVDNKRKRILENKIMFLHNRNNTIELNIEYYLSNILTTGTYIYIYIYSNNKVICSVRMRFSFQTKFRMIHFIKRLHKICFKISCNQ